MIDPWGRGPRTGNVHVQNVVLNCQFGQRRTQFSTHDCPWCSYENELFFTNFWKCWVCYVSPTGAAFGDRITTNIGSQNRTKLCVSMATHLLVQGQTWTWMLLLSTQGFTRVTRYSGCFCSISKNVVGCRQMRLAVFGIRKFLIWILSSITIWIKFWLEYYWLTLIINKKMVDFLIVLINIQL